MKLVFVGQRSYLWTTPLNKKKTNWKPYYIRIYANTSSLWSMAWRISLYTQPSNTTNLLIFLYITSPHSRVSTFISVGVRWENYTCVIRYSNSSDLRLFGISQLVFNKEKKAFLVCFLSIFCICAIILYVGCSDIMVDGWRCVLMLLYTDILR